MSGRTAATVTVVIPSYNRAQCLPPTVESVLAQTAVPAEIIVVDDGSTDDTATTCAAFGSAVRYIAQAKRGVAAARNTGVRAARGEWIAFLDADDIWLPRKLEIQLAAIAAHPAVGWCTTNHTTTDQAGKPLPGIQGFARDLPGFAGTKRSPERLLAEDLDRSVLTVGGEPHVIFSGDCFRLFCIGNLVLPSAVIVRRSDFLAAGGFDERLRVASDTEFFHRLSARSRGAFVMTPLLAWRRGRSDTIVSTTNVVPLIETGLASLRAGAQLRGSMTPAVRRTARSAERRLLRRLAYAHLTRFDRGAVRAVALGGQGAGRPRDPLLWVIFFLSLAPRSLLGAAWRAKRLLRR